MKTLIQNCKKCNQPGNTEMHLYTTFGERIFLSHSERGKKKHLSISWAFHSIWLEITTSWAQAKIWWEKNTDFPWKPLGKYLPYTAVQAREEAKSLYLRSVFVRAGISPCWKGSFSHILRGNVTGWHSSHCKPSQESKEFFLLTTRSHWHQQSNCTVGFLSAIPAQTHAH